MGNRRKIGRRSWGLLGTLWLVMVCLSGCAFSGGTVRDNERTQVSGELEESSQESDKGGDSEEDGWEDDKGDDSGANNREELDAESETEIDIKSDMEPEDAGNGDDSSIEGTDAGGIEESGVYTSKDEVALYLHVYGCLPDNYITKREAEELGWNSKEGNLWEVAPGMSIGGSRFGNYEGALPDKKGRKYFECDIDYEGGYRGAKRLIYSDDGLIFYTEDHYNTFEQLYGE